MALVAYVFYVDTVGIVVCHPEIVHYFKSHKSKKWVLDKHRPDTISSSIFTNYHFHLQSLQNTKLIYVFRSQTLLFTRKLPYK
jgi:hypothetical protein